MAGITSPKSVVFFVAVLPQIVDYTSGAIPFQLALLGAAFLLIAIASDSLWASLQVQPANGSPGRPAGFQRWRQQSGP
ncbi:UNVERIFIED_ORG: threonine/homoserine/homoserine lactone efflux protein [Arthrobacter sp. UYCu721]